MAESSPVIPHKYWRTLDISFATENSKWKNNTQQIKCVIFNSLRALGHDKENSLKRVINSFNSEFMGEMSNNNIKVHLTEPEIIFLHADLQQYLSQSCGAFVCMAAQKWLNKGKAILTAPLYVIKNYADRFKNIQQKSSTKLIFNIDW